MLSEKLKLFLIGNLRKRFGPTDGLNATCIQRHHSKLGRSKTLQLEAICWNKRTNRVHYQHAKIEEIFGFQVQQKRTPAGSQLKKIKQWKGIRSFRLNATMVFLSENEKSP
jgi:hypothetical protein